MFFKIICVVVFASSVLCRNVPNFNDLDEEDKILFRAAYESYDTQSYNHDTQSYNHDTQSYNHDTSAYSHDTPSYGYNNYNNEIPISKFDLLKDGIWALKAKVKELKVFNKALAANLLSTKLHLKDMLGHLKPLKTHQHIEIDTKPVYSYQATSPPPSYPQHVSAYEQPHPQYTAPASPQYNAPAPQYTAHHYGPPQPAHDPYYGH